MLNSLPGTDPARLARLIDVLDIDPTWRMHLVSDGQRRRVQIAMGMLIIHISRSYFYFFNHFLSSLNTCITLYLAKLINF